MEWFWVNIAAPLGAPAGFAVLIWLLELLRGNSEKLEILTAYVDGQAGFVAMAWCAATLYEMDHYETCMKQPVDWHGLTFVLGAIIFFSGLMAQAGARWSVTVRDADFAKARAEATTNNTQPPAAPGLVRHYLAGWLSLLFVVVSLCLMVVIHLLVTQPGGPKC